MNNHTDSFRPPQNSDAPPDGKQVFQASIGLIFIALGAVGAFWAMLSKRPGTVGTRAYHMDVLFGFILLVTLAQHPLDPDRVLFQCSAVLLPILYAFQINATLKADRHIHTKTIGASRFGKGDDGNLKEMLIGAMCGACLFVAGCMPFGVFIIASAFAHAMTIGLTEERHRQLNVRMADAMAEQQLMMEKFEEFRNERPVE